MKVLLLSLPYALLCACSVGMVEQEGSVIGKPLEEIASENGIVCEASGTYPVVSDLMSRQVEVNINGYFEDFAYRVKNDIEGCPALMKDLVTEGATLKDTTTIAYDMKRLDDTILSIVLTRSQYFEGAAHPNNTIETMTFDLEDGQPVTLRDLFRDDVDVEAMLTGNIRKALIQADLESEYPSAMSKPIGAFYLTDTSLVLVDLFDTYALQGFEVHVPLDELQDILKE